MHSCFSWRITAILQIASPKFDCFGVLLSSDAECYAGFIRFITSVSNAIVKGLDTIRSILAGLQLICALLRYAVVPIIHSVNVEGQDCC
jgi:hypothetical protein